MAGHGPPLAAQNAQLATQFREAEASVVRLGEEKFRLTQELRATIRAKAQLEKELLVRSPVGGPLSPCGLDSLT